MTSISLNPEKMNPSTVAIYDLMSDGEWHSNQSLISYGSALCAEDEHDDALKNGRRVRRKAIASGKNIDDADLVLSGAKDMVRNRLMIAVRGERMERTKTHHRMTADAVTAWVALRPNVQRPVLAAVPANEAAVPAPSGPVTSASSPKAHLRAVPSTRNHQMTSLGSNGSDDSGVTDTDISDADVTDADTSAIPGGRKGRNTQPTEFGGLSEAEGWATAPLHLKSRVHFKVDNGEVPLDEFREALPLGSEVAFDEGTGLYRVDCAHGTGNDIRDFIREWCLTRNIRAKSLRAEHDVRRRTLNDLNPAFLSELCLWYAKYSQARVNKHRSTLQFHFTDRDDQDQQIFEWILEAVSRYDAESGVPFGAFLSERIGKWVHDLNRNKYGRIVSDTELKYQRAKQEFTTIHGRQPTEAELAHAMGQNLETFRKNAQVVSTVQGLRNIGTLDVAPGENEVHLPDEDLCDDRYNNELQQSMLSQILTASCEVDPDTQGKLKSRPNVLGFVAWYEALWGGKNKTELSTGLGTSMRNMNEYAARTEERMQARQAELIGD